MANKSNMSLQKGRKRVRMRSRILFLILFVVILQLIISIAVLIFGGEFHYLKEYSYHTLVEKTENVSTYIRNELHEKPVIVQRYAEQIDNEVDRILNERGVSISDIKTDKELDYNIIESSVDIVSDLLQNSNADDAYLILDTGALYADESSDTANAALYLKNAWYDSESGGLEIIIGFDSIAADFGLTRNSDFSQYFTVDPTNISGADFYFTTLQTAQENNTLSQNELGYWSRFSEISSDATPSMKYSLPLIAEDGTVYGIIGIGLTEKTILSDIISNDVKDDTACYILGYSNTDKRYDILVRSGSLCGTLLGNASTLRVKSMDGENVYRFDMVTDAELFGSVHDMEMYSGNSPYIGEQWALISVADRSDVLWPFLFQQRMMVTSALMSIIVVVIAAIVGSGIIVKPLSNLSSQIKNNRKYNNEVVRFQPSKIYEIDEITDAIIQMQINIHGFSSQVSKMISIADVGLGTFMYDRTEDTVFIGQSLIDVLKLSLPQGEDIVMKRQEFLNSIKNPEVRAPISDGMEIPVGEMRKDHSEEYEINKLSGGKLWIRLGFTYSPSTVVGIVQDITYAIMEKNRIEYERDYDHLTGLLNRNAYYRRVEKLFHDKAALKVTAFVMVDLDNLKYVNDTYGHNFGDDYIKTAALALKKFQEHGGIVSRLSGDEFSICLPGFDSKEAARKIITYVRGELLGSSCLLADGTHFKISGSMGVSWYPDDSDSRELLMKYADFAMYTIKHSTKGSIAEFDFNTYSTDALLITGVEEMNRIIDEESVRYAFQSIVSAKTGEIYGYEALMRVQSEIFKSPLELLRTARTGAKLYEIERLTLTRSLADFQALIEAGRIEKTAHIFINSIANNRLEADVETAIKKKYEDIGKQVVLEILESETSDEECTTHKAECVRDWGGQLALDDFGTGYNSEYALLNIRPNIIKIDRSIISGCEKDFDRRMIIENLVKLSKSKGILVLAEGVETKEELETVISCGVDLLQGYYLARPLFEPEPLSKELTDTIRRLANANNSEL